MPSIVGRPGQGQEMMFSPDSVTWKVNREAALLLGGGRALLLQLAHPAVAAGVDQHSSFRERPLRRLRRTLDLSYTLAFGTRAEAAAAARQINTRHREVRGAGYRALDADLLLWVYATLVDSSLATYSTFIRPLGDAERAAYLEESVAGGRLFGIPAGSFPRGPDQFDRYMERMIEDELRVDARARRLAADVLAPPAGPLSLPARFPMETITAGLLPEELRTAYRLRWGPGRRLAFASARAALAGLLPLTPALIRHVPAARRAR